MSASKGIIGRVILWMPMDFELLQEPHLGARGLALACPGLLRLPGHRLRLSPGHPFRMYVLEWTLNLSAMQRLGVRLRRRPPAVLDVYRQFVGKNRTRG